MAFSWSAILHLWKWVPSVPLKVWLSRAKISFENLNSVSSEQVKGQQCKNCQSFWNIVFSTQPCVLVLFSFHFYYNSNLYYNIHIVKRVWLRRQIISKSETFCLHPRCWYTCKSAWSKRCDKWHIVIKMPDKIGCRCHPIITVLYTLLGLLSMLTALNKENFFFCKEQFQTQRCGNS